MLIDDEDDHDESCIAVALLQMLIPALIRAGDVREGTILALADAMDHEAQTSSVERTDELERMSMALRTMVLEASGSTLSDFQANRRRQRIHVIRNKDDD